MRSVRSPLAASALRFLVAFAASLVGVPASAQPTPLGPEVALDPEPGSYREGVALAGRADGRIGVVWERVPPDDSGPSTLVVAASDAEGQVIGTVELARDARVVALTAHDDGYDLLWQRFRRYPIWDTWASRLDLDGQPSAARVAIAPRGATLSPRPRGGYVAHWRGGRSIFVQLRDERGLAASPIVRLQLSASSVLSVLHRADGGFLVVHSRGRFRISDPDLVDLGVWAQPFDAQGRRAGRAFQLVPRPGPGLYSSGLAALGADGTIAVATSLYHSDVWTNDNVTLRIYSAGGALLCPPVAITGPNEESFEQAIAVDPSGRVLVVWARAAPYPATIASARVFSPRGEPMGPVFSPSSAASEPHSEVLWVSADWAGDAWVLAWTAATSFAAPELSMQVYLRRFAR